MSFLETMFLFFMGLFGIVQTSADVQSPYYPSRSVSFRVAQEAPPSGGSFSPPPSGGTFSPPPGDSGGGGGSFQPPPSGGGFGGDHQPPPGGDQGQFGGQPGGQFGGQPGGQFGGQPGGQQFGPGQQGGQFGGQQGFGGQGGEHGFGQGQPGQGGQQGQFGPNQGGQFGDQKGFGPGQQGGFDQGQQRQGGQQGPGGQQGQFGGEQGFGGQQGGQRGEGQFGGEMNEEQDAQRQAQQEKQCMEGMKRGIQQFEKGGPLKEINRLVAKLKQQKITVPAATTETVATIKAALAKIKAATTCEDTQAAMEEFQEAQGSLEEIMPQLHFLTEAPRIKREINQGFKQIDRRWKTTLARAKSSKVDLSELIAKGQAFYDEIKGMFDKFIAVINSGDVAEIEGLMEEGDGARDKADELFEIADTIEAMRNMSKFVQQMNREVNNFKKVIRDLQRKKVDVSELVACVDGLKPVLDNLNVEAKRRPADTEALIAAFEGSQDALDECQDKANEARGIEEEGLFDDFFGDKLNKTFDEDRTRRAKAQPTCRVDGVEVPGTCAEVEGRGVAAPPAPIAPAPTEGGAVAPAPVQ